eukprot:5081870-Ditylum_brightwellii.AAC.1
MGLNSEPYNTIVSSWGWMYDSTFNWKVLRTFALCVAASISKENLRDGALGLSHGLLAMRSTVIENSAQSLGVKVGGVRGDEVGVLAGRELGALRGFLT